MAKKQFMIRRDDEALALGFELKKSKRYHLDKDQERTLHEIRAAKKMGIPLDKIGQFSNSPYYWDKTKEHSFFIKHPLFKEEEKDTFAKDLIEEIK